LFVTQWVNVIVLGQEFAPDLVVTVTILIVVVAPKVIKDEIS